MNNTIRPPGKHDQAAMAAYQCQMHFSKGRGPVFTLQCFWKAGSGAVTVLEEEWNKLSTEGRLAWMREKIGELYTSLKEAENGNF